MHPPQLTIEIEVHGDGTDAVAVRCTVRNTGEQPVQVFDSPRMPYLLDDQGTLVVLHGVHAPPADRDFNIIEIPLTRALGHGETFGFEMALAPLRLRDHYGEAAAGPPRHGSVPVVCRVGHGATPITAADRPTTTIEAVLAWQQVTSSTPITVTLP